MTRFAWLWLALAVPALAWEQSLQLPVNRNKQADPVIAGMAEIAATVMRTNGYTHLQVHFSADAQRALLWSDPILRAACITNTAYQWTPARCQRLAGACWSNDVRLIISLDTFTKQDGGLLVLAHPEYRERQTPTCRMLCLSDSNALATVRGMLADVVTWFSYAGVAPLGNTHLEEFRALDWPATNPPCWRGCVPGREQDLYVSLVNSLTATCRALGTEHVVMGDTLYCGGYSYPLAQVPALSNVYQRTDLDRRGVVVWDWRYTTNTATAGRFRSVADLTGAGYRVIGATWSNQNAATAMQLSLQEARTNGWGWATVAWDAATATNLARAWRGQDAPTAEVAALLPILRDNGKLAGLSRATWTWTPPTETMNGQPLIGPVEYRLTCYGAVQSWDRTTAATSAVVAGVPSGTTRWECRASNTAGEGVPAERYYRNDASPYAPGGLTNQ